MGSHSLLSAGSGGGNGLTDFHWPIESIFTTGHCCPYLLSLLPAICHHIQELLSVITLWPTPPSPDSPFGFWKIHFPTSYLFNCYFSALFFGLSSYFLTSGTSKVYSSIFCSCLLMMCFLETRIPVSATFSVRRTSKSLLQLYLWPLLMSPSSKQKHKEEYFTLVLVGVLTPQARRDEEKKRLQETRRRELGRAGHLRACSNFQWMVIASPGLL